MDFDHLPQYKKKAKLSNMLSAGFSEKAILQEAQKCEVVCANCHRIRTSARAHENKLSRVRMTSDGR